MRSRKRGIEVSGKTISFALVASARRTYVARIGGEGSGPEFGGGPALPRLRGAPHRGAGGSEHDEYLPKDGRAPSTKGEPYHAAERHRYEGQTEHADDRRVTLRRPAYGCVTRRQPRKAGEDPAPQPFEERPRGRDQKAGAHGRLRRDARLEPTGRGRKQREKGAEEERGEGRQRQRHGAEGMQADVDP